MASPTSIKPMLPEEEAKDLEDLATDLVAKVERAVGTAQPRVCVGVGDSVRSMNCYYSNLIEGLEPPADIDRALTAISPRTGRSATFSWRPAHIEVQRMIDRGEAPAPVSRRIHPVGPPRILPRCRTTCCGSKIGQTGNGARRARRAAEPPRQGWASCPA